MQKGFSPVLIIGIIFIIGIVVGSYYLGTIKNSPQSQNPTLSCPPAINANLKTYTNNLSHFKLEIPSDWIIQEGARPDGWPTAEIYSPDKEIVIRINYKFEDIYESEISPPLPDIQLGQYKTTPRGYISGSKTIYGISLYDVPDQLTFSPEFSISGNFDQNNARLLKILNSFAFTQKEPPATSYFTYVLPPAWRVEKDDFQGTSFTSLDYKTDNQRGYPVSGVRMAVTRRKMEPNEKTLQDVIDSLNEHPQKPNSIEPARVDGIDGKIRIFNGWRQILLVKDNYLWQISAFTSGVEDDDKYRQEIDSFINSIKLK